MAMKKCQAMTDNHVGNNICPRRAKQVIALRCSEDLFLAVWVCKEHLAELQKE